MLPKKLYLWSLFVQFCLYSIILSYIILCIISLINCWFFPIFFFKNAKFCNRGGTGDVWSVWWRWSLLYEHVETRQEVGFKKGKFYANVTIEWHFILLHIKKTLLYTLFYLILKSSKAISVSLSTFVLILSNIRIFFELRLEISLCIFDSLISLKLNLDINNTFSFIILILGWFLYLLIAISTLSEI